jgi:PAT family beta-lactamase induction signal transducer AmpG
MKGFSGVIVENLSASHGLMGAYAIFFVGAGLIGLPAVLLFVLLAAQHRASRRAN